MKMECFESAELSDLGKKRKNNEDACLRIPDKGIFCVADGMGGVVGGDLASEAITTSVQKVLAEAAPEECGTVSGLIALFEKAVNQASKWIKNFADEKIARGMGSTVVALVLDPRNATRAIGLHAGDSRLYRYRNGELRLLTSDHTAAAALAAKLGRAEKSLPAQYQNQLTRAVGLSECVELERTPVDVASGDLFLLCSDGLTRMVPDKAIAKILKQRSQEAGAAIAKALIDVANRAGGNDNVTVVLVKIGDISAAAKEPEPAPEEESKTLMAMVCPPVAEASVASPPPGENPVTPETPDTYRGDTPRGDDTADQPPPSVPRQEEKPAPAKDKPAEKQRPETAGKPVPWKGIGVAAAAVVCLGIGFWLRQGTGRSKNDSQSAVGSAAETNVVPVHGSVAIQSEPSGAEVFADGKRVGATPYAADALTPGQVTYVLGTATHTGTVVATVRAGEKFTTNVMLAARLGAVQVTSDPPGAEVWSGNQRQGVTPMRLRLAAGTQMLTLKHSGLEERAVTVTVVADQTVQANAVFAYGGVLIQSELSGAVLSRDGQAVGQTPYTNAVMRPGAVGWQLVADEHVPTNVTVQVTDHETKTVRVTLERGRGTLKMTSNQEDVKVWLDGASMGALPTNLPVEAGVEHTVVAEYKGQQQTNSAVRVKMNETKSMTFAFEEVKMPEEVKTWTNRLGMAFVKLPGKDFWVGATRVTPQQYEQIMGGTLNNDQKGKDGKDDSQSCVINVYYEDARSFAMKLTAKLKEAHDLPPDCDSCQFAIPNAQQWQDVAEASEARGLQMSSLRRFFEWCVIGDDQGTLAYGGYSPPHGTLAIRNFTSQPQRNEARWWMTIRVVLVR